MKRIDLTDKKFGLLTVLKYHHTEEKLRINDKLQKHVLKLIQRRKKDLSGLEMLLLY